MESHELTHGFWFIGIHAQILIDIDYMYVHVCMFYLCPLKGSKTVVLLSQLACLVLGFYVRGALLSVGFSRQDYWSGLPLPASSRGFSQSGDGTCVSYVSCINREVFLLVPCGKPLFTNKTWAPKSNGFLRTDKGKIQDGSKTSCCFIKQGTAERMMEIGQNTIGANLRDSTGGVQDICSSSW